ncbi:MAG: aminotransferase class III-fold pyridoxal phosphate-dependent enzyme, partial [Desulforhabdus sp.]|nr:aminotransferase class III-fold pyridoxal phosphate-dependent enzyme [Desulforhabdus sp.]
IQHQVSRGLLTSYIFANQPRLELADRLIEVAPPGLDKVALFCTGSEAVECCLKSALTYSLNRFGPRKKHVVGFHNGFHGRTMGAQLAGGIDSQKEWIPVDRSPYLLAPYPDGLFGTPPTFDVFLDVIERSGIEAKDISAVILEPYQGGIVKLAPTQYVQKLRCWCDENDVVLIFDEVQSGFGRTGRLWGHEHYGVTPDLIACGKGLSCSLPISAAIGRADVLDLFKPGAMSTTHSGNPLSCAAALAALNALLDEGYISKAKEIELVLSAFFESQKTKPWRNAIHYMGAAGAVGAIMLRQESASVAQLIVENAVAKGALLFNPVGPWGSTIKLCPPLCIDENDLRIGLEIIEEAIEESFNVGRKYQ